MKRSECHRYNILKAWQGVRMLTDEEQEELERLDRRKKMESAFRWQLSIMVLSAVSAVANLIFLIF